MVDIWGNHFTEEDFDRILEEHPDAMERIKDVEEYRFMLNWNQLSFKFFQVFQVFYCFTLFLEKLINILYKKCRNQRSNDN